MTNQLMRFDAAKIALTKARIIDEEERAGMTDSIIRVCKNKDHPYVIVNKNIFEDQRISWEARGLMGYLLSKPDNWQVRMYDLIARDPHSGRERTRRILKELEGAGYIRRTKVRLADGTLGWVTTVYEQPELVDKDDSKLATIDGSTIDGSTVYGKPVDGKPVDGKPVDILNTDVLSTDLLSTDAVSSCETCNEPSKGRRRTPAKRTTQQQPRKDKEVTPVLTPVTALEPETDNVAAHLIRLVEGCGVLLNAYQSELWLDLLHITRDIKLLDAAFREAGVSSNRLPTPKYVRAILERCVNEGVAPGVRVRAPDGPLMHTATRKATDCPLWLGDGEDVKT